MQTDLTISPEDFICAEERMKKKAVTVLYEHNICLCFSLYISC